MPRCDLHPGAALFYERFEGFDGLKDRYFIVVCNGSPFVECFTTTTKLHAVHNPRLAAEYCEILQGECCLPKRCFVDFRQVHEFDDIQLSSWLRSRSVKHIGDLPDATLQRVRDALSHCRSVSPIQKRRLIAAIDAVLHNPHS